MSRVAFQAMASSNGTAGVAAAANLARRNLDFAAAFGPVTGLATEVNFTDLLGMESAPGQVAQNCRCQSRRSGV